MKSRLIALGWALFCLVGLEGPTAPAGIVYDATTDTIAVRFFPVEWPCTPERLAAMDRLCGWNKVTHDPSNDTWTVHAHLVIGANDGSETCFQVGSPERPRETLVVHGNVRVHPYWIKGANPGLWYTARRSLHRLTLGCAGNTNVVATLKIASAPKAKRTLTLGVHPGREAYGGQLHVYGGTITALVQDEAHRLGSAESPGVGMILRGEETVLRGATLSWMDGVMCYGAQNFKATAAMHVRFDCQDTLFEHGGTALSDHGQTTVRGCAFKNMDCAVRDSGGINLVLVDCAFRNNRRNWELIYSAKGLVAVDCAIEPGARPDKYAAWLNPATQKRQYPSFEAQRHIVVEVLDTNRAPLAKARVEVRPLSGDAADVENGRVQTDVKGRTPGLGEKTAVRLRETVCRATDTNQPAVRTCAYEIKASSAGYRTEVLPPIAPTGSWQVFTLTLPREGGGP